MKTPSNCPHCNAVLDKEDIYAYFLEKEKDEAKAIKNASYFGWTKEKPVCFSKWIGLYSYEKDMTVAWECPECNSRWSKDMKTLLFDGRESKAPLA